ncbi:hypothetical protein Q668_04180 [Alcanivorax sp. PN-3]|nr:hypothetical protein Q668_04180 [Alcanivorax sp. PN-3]
MISRIHRVVRLRPEEPALVADSEKASPASAGERVSYHCRGACSWPMRRHRERGMAAAAQPAVGE